MKIKNFVKKYWSDFSVNEMFDLFKEMGYYKKDYSDWSSDAYETGLVDEIDEIKKPEKMNEILKDYKNKLITFSYSRENANSDTKSLFVKDYINNNVILKKFIGRK